jgi:HSP20 family molecular chaperone IbpA
MRSKILAIFSAFHSSINHFIKRCLSNTKADVIIKVTDENTDQLIPGARATIRYLDLNTEASTFSDSKDNDGYINTKKYDDGDYLNITVEKSGYIKKEIIVQVEARASLTFEVLAELTPNPEEIFLKDEMLSIDECESGFESKFDFDDGQGKEIHHCIKLAPFNPGDEYVTDSYLERRQG